MNAPTRSPGTTNRTRSFSSLDIGRKSARVAARAAIVQLEPFGTRRADYAAAPRRPTPINEIRASCHRTKHLQGTT
jgi:hypothetical protein